MREVSHIFLFRVLSVFNRLNIRGLRRFTALLSKKCISEPTETYVLKTRHGFKLKISPQEDKGIDNALHYFGTYESGTLHFIKKYLKKNQIFVDVGANIGVHALHASKRVGDHGRVIAFEPYGKTRKILLENIQLNATLNIEVLGYAVGNREAHVSFYPFKNSKGEGSLVQPRKSELSPEGAVMISLTKLDSVLFNERVNMIKIDIEGLELEALKGAKKLLQQKPILIIECTSATESEHSNREDLFFYLQQLNYEIFKLKGGKSRKGKLVRVITVADLPDGDNLFCFSNTM